MDNLERGRKVSWLGGVSDRKIPRKARNDIDCPKPTEIAAAIMENRQAVMREMQVLGALLEE